MLLSLPRRQLMQCLISLFLLLTAKASHAESIQIDKDMWYLEDPSHSLDLAGARAASGWSQNDTNVFNKGYSDSTWWVKFTVQPWGPNNDYILQVAYAVLDHLNVYVIQSNGDVDAYIMGDKLPFASRPLKHRLFSVPFTATGGAPVEIYLKAKSSSSIQLPVTLSIAKSFWEDNIAANVVHGVYLGGMLCIAIYNLLIFVVLRDKTYLFYVAYVTSMCTFFACLNGWAYQYLWPTAVWWNDQAILITLNCVMFFGVVFIRRFLTLHELGGIGYHLSSLWILISGLGFVFLLLAPYGTGIRMLIPFAVIFCTWSLFAGMFAWSKGHPSAGIYMLAWSGMLIGGIILALNKLQILPRNLLTDYATQMGSLIEVLLLSFAMAERINRERALRLQAQNEALAMQTAANASLEKRVEERTLELEAANRKLQELSDTDQLTGQKNRRFLDQYLDNEFARAQRYQHGISVLLIDIDHFKKVNDTWGHLAGDECIKAVAQRICQQMHRPTDLTARYGGEEFCVVLPETALEGAVTIAERIRQAVASSPVTTLATHLNITVSIGAASLRPGDELSVTTVLNQADSRLYMAKEQGRNRVISAGG